MDTIKKLFKYFIIVLTFYIISNIMMAHIMKPQVSKANTETEFVSNVDFNWEEMSRDPMFVFIILGGLIVTLT